STEATGSENGRLEKDHVAAIALSSGGEVLDVFLLEDIVFDSEEKKIKEKRRERLERGLAGAILVVDSRIAGLRDGLLDRKADDRPRTADDGDLWIEHVNNIPVIRFRVREVDPEETRVTDPEWRQSFRLETNSPDDGEPRCFL